VQHLTAVFAIQCNAELDSNALSAHDVGGFAKLLNFDDFNFVVSSRFIMPTISRTVAPLLVAISSSPVVSFACPCHTQTITAASTTEAKFLAAVEAAKVAKHLCLFFTSLVSLKKLALLQFLKIMSLPSKWSTSVVPSLVLTMSRHPAFSNARLETSRQPQIDPHPGCID
jgi:hypothetical protein